ncbi:hypothetical protein B7463_g3901, partial [Scytalidium lignicola]
MASNMPNNALEILPAIPMLVERDPQQRIKQLKDHLKEDCWKFQVPNNLKLVELYETGELKPPSYGTTIWLCNGKVLEKQPDFNNIARGSVTWAEGIGMQMMQHALSQMAKSATTFGFLGATSMHERPSRLNTSKIESQRNYNDL